MGGGSRAVEAALAGKAVLEVAALPSSSSCCGCRRGPHRRAGGGATDCRPRRLLQQNTDDRAGGDYLVDGVTCLRRVAGVVVQKTQQVRDELDAREGPPCARLADDREDVPLMKALDELAEKAEWECLRGARLVDHFQEAAVGVVVVALRNNHLLNFRDQRQVNLCAGARGRVGGHNRYDDSKGVIVGRGVVDAGQKDVGVLCEATRILLDLCEAVEEADDERVDRVLDRHPRQ